MERAQLSVTHIFVTTVLLIEGAQLEPVSSGQTRTRISRTKSYDQYPDLSAISFTGFTILRQTDSRPDNKIGQVLSWLRAWKRWFIDGSQTDLA